MGYLTLSAIPAGNTCRVLFIPDSEEVLAIVRGALQLLTFPESWVPYGATTPDQSSAAFNNMFDRFCFDEGNCRMVGEVVTWAGTATPSPRWLECDGASYLRADWPDLFNVIGATYGAVDGSHFNVPDLRGRAIIGVGTGSGLTPRALGDSIGEEQHVLTVAELASHSHIDSGHSHTEGGTIPTAITIGPGAPAPSAIGSPSVTGLGSASISNAGSDGGHNTIQPSFALSFWIVATDG